MIVQIPDMNYDSQMQRSEMLPFIDTQKVSKLYWGNLEICVKLIRIHNGREI